MNKKALSLAITLAMAIPTLTNALSLGDIESNSSLNQPFKGKINLHSTTVAEAKSLQIRVASQAVFNRVGIDRPAFLNSIRFRTTIQNGRPVILVSSNQPINEPFLNFLLEVSWPNGQLLKEYTVLLDPPVLLRPDTAIASNNAGVRSEPRRAQGRITRPVAQSPQQIQQQRIAQQRRQAQAQRQVQAQRQAQAQQRIAQQRQQAAQQARRATPPTAEQRFNANARRVLANQQASRAVASTNRTYRVRRGDTLSKVAKKLGYRGVRSEQMMVALFEKNRRAFSKNNMNNLKSGALIKRPSLQEARVLSARKSKAQIIAQAREWKNTRGNVASSQSKKAVNTSANNTQARLTVAGTSNRSNAVAPGSSVAKLTEQLTMTNESLTSKQKENEELKSRVTELESLLRKKNRLITLKSAQLAKLQAGVSGTPEEVVIQQEVLVSEVNEGNDIQQQIANDIAQDNGEIIRNGEDQFIPSEEVNDEALSENMEGEELAIEEESAFVDETVSSDTDILGLLSSPTALGIGGGSLLALLGGLWYMRRRRSEDGEYEEFSSIDIDNQMDEPLFEDDNINPASIDESEFLAHDDDRHEYMKNSEETKDDGEEDILQEADVYIVYGLHDQAESELKQAIENDPENMAYRAKLLENYKAAGDVGAFETEAKTFMELDFPDKDKYLEDIKEWSRALNPESKLFSGAAAATVGAGVAMVAGTALSEDIEADNFDIEDGLEDFNLDDILSDNDGDDDNFIDNIGESSIDVSDLGDDLDLDDMDDNLDNVSNSVKFEEITKSNELDSIDDLLSDADDIDIMGDLDSKLDNAQDFDKELELTNLNLDIGSDDFEKLMPEDTAYKSTIDEIENSVDSLDDDLEDNLLADFDDNLSFLDLDDDADVIEETQVDTKLDLAKAYIDMGDIEGARSTLEEVMLDGSEDQKREAEELLHSTG